MGNPSSPEALAVRWAEIEQDVTLRDLPYKIEINAWGKIEMSPATFWHGRMQGAVAAALVRYLSDGEVLTKIPIQTDIGIRVPDVAWGSRAYLERNANASPATEAPEICVEVVSPSNSAEEIREKTRAYLAAGAEEVWIVSEEGACRFFAATGEVTKSRYAVTLNLPKRS